ncbi:LCP family protein [Clavibacter sepedonicus]|uniref:Transcriptional regulator n=1 Tax=Clavibacter sepedonicus TaxID=31964 RepID=B0RI73_CLASE|nr:MULTISPECIES: LCP family protein [Clavibacter]MBD5382299.1 LytR family transcriptional regulator [Clavibacter sp.]OQJ48205.1 LytR family transcriptional regulator [Clavibacter sepedonicus]OQJ54547.1 LytR family transcriptional regulator [Clavibacter sepedonicus]UUK66117.1 LCP family protein [Clavibacter sepedonicus]CAQ02644.1 putative transcriptional regulator [Clavibacter sepedonicus]
MPHETRHDRSLAPGIARHGRLRKPSAVRTAVLAVVVVAAVAVVSTGSVAAVAAWDLARTVQANAVDIGDGKAAPPSIGGIDGGANILLVGGDTREGQGDGYGTGKDVQTGNLNDVTMLLHISEDHTRATVVSFPRDMLVDMPACTRPDASEEPASSDEQINVALKRGGLPCVVRTVEAITGLEVPYGGVIQFNGVLAMSNAVGGVPVCVAKRIYDPKTDLDLQPGVHPLQGREAVQFLRTRHGVGDGSDIDRISNQQVFLSALLRTITSTDTLTNPAKLYGIARAAVDNMVLSTSLDTPSAITSLALTAKDIPLDRFTFVQYPSIRLESQRVAQDVVKGDEMIRLIAADADFSLAPGSTGQGVAAPEPAAGETPAPDAGSTPSAEPSAPAVLPSGVTGQTAAEETCSNG